MLINHIIHHALLGFSWCLSKSLMWLALMLYSLVAVYIMYIRFLCEFLTEL